MTTPNITATKGERVIRIEEETSSHLWVREDKALELTAGFIKELIDHGQLLVAPGQEEFFADLLKTGK